MASVVSVIPFPQNFKTKNVTYRHCSNDTTRGILFTLILTGGRAEDLTASDLGNQAP